MATRLSDAEFGAHIRKSNRIASQKLREKRWAEGLVQVTMWVPVKLKDKLDRGAGVRNLTISETATEILSAHFWPADTSQSGQAMATPTPLKAATDTLTADLWNNTQTQVEGATPALTASIESTALTTADMFEAPTPAPNEQPDRAPIRQPDRAAVLHEANQLSQTGLSWVAIADQFNARGWRTENGAVFRGQNLSRQASK